MQPETNLPSIIRCEKLFHVSNFHRISVCVLDKEYIIQLFNRIIVLQLHIWVYIIGYLLVYGIILAKMWRVYQIFQNPTTKKKNVCTFN